MVTTPGITVMSTPRAAAAAVMPGVSVTPGQPEPGDARDGVQSSAPCGALPRQERHFSADLPFAVNLDVLGD